MCRLRLHRFQVVTDVETGCTRQLHRRYRDKWPLPGYLQVSVLLVFQKFAADRGLTRFLKHAQILQIFTTFLPDLNADCGSSK